MLRLIDLLVLKVMIAMGIISRVMSVLAVLRMLLQRVNLTPPLPFIPLPLPLNQM